MYAAIDLGSNSFHLLIAHCDNQQLEIVERYSETVQLGRGLNENNQICEEAMSRGLACLADFKASVSHYPIKSISCFGTNALRVATNRDVFLNRAREVGFDIEVISGEREAELIYRGVSSRLPAANDNRLVFDIGGGSTEFAAGVDNQPRRVFSSTIGCVSWRDRFFYKGKIKKKYFEAAYNAALEALEPVAQQFGAGAYQQIYASSGTAKMLCAIAREMGLEAGVITPKSLKKIRKAVYEFSSVKAISLKGLKPQRQDLLLPGLAIMGAILESLDIDRVQFSPTAMREGMLQEIAANEIGAPVQAR